VAGTQLGRVSAVNAAVVVVLDEPYTTISNPDYLTPRDQAALVAQLQVGLREDGHHDAARNDIVMLLNKLRDREDVT
jgi:hypothetical protein